MQQAEYPFYEARRRVGKLEEKIERKRETLVMKETRKALKNIGVRIKIGRN